MPPYISLIVPTGALAPGEFVTGPTKREVITLTIPSNPGHHFIKCIMVQTAAHFPIFPSPFAALYSPSSESTGLPSDSRMVSRTWLAFTGLKRSSRL